MKMNFSSVNWSKFFLVQLFAFLIAGYAFVYNISTSFLFNQYIDSDDLYFLFAPRGVAWLHYPFVTLIVFIIISFLLSMIINRETRKAGYTIGWSFTVLGLMILFLVNMGDHSDTAQFVFFSMVGQTSVFVLLPLLVVLPIVFFISEKLKVNEIGVVFVLAVIALAINIAYINTCGFGNNAKCELRQRIIKFDASACEVPGLATFEKNNCYTLIAAYSGDTNLCSSVVTYDKHSGFTWPKEDCLNRKKFDDRLLYHF